MSTTPEVDPEIAILGRADGGAEVTRGGITKLSDFLYERAVVKSTTVQEHVAQFLKALQRIVCDTPNEFGDYVLDTITFTAEVDARGRLSLLGAGGELASKGGISFTLKRK